MQQCRSGRLAVVAAATAVSVAPAALPVSPAAADLSLDLACHELDLALDWDLPAVLLGHLLAVLLRHLVRLGHALTGLVGNLNQHIYVSHGAIPFLVAYVVPLCYLTALGVRNLDLLLLAVLLGHSLAGLPLGRAVALLHRFAVAVVALGGRLALLLVGSGTLLLVLCLVTLMALSLVTCRAFLLVSCLHFVAVTLYCYIVKFSYSKVRTLHKIHSEIQFAVGEN